MKVCLNTKMHLISNTINIIGIIFAAKDLKNNIVILHFRLKGRYLLNTYFINM